MRARRAGGSRSHSHCALAQAPAKLNDTASAARAALFNGIRILTGYHCTAVPPAAAAPVRRRPPAQRLLWHVTMCGNKKLRITTVRE